jgi:hypothetical protein
LDTPQGKQKYHKVLFEVSNARALKFVDCRLVCHRLNGTVTKEKAESSVNYFKLAAAPIAERTVPDWEKWRKEEDERKKAEAAKAAAAPAAAAAAPVAADAAKMGADAAAMMGADAAAMMGGDAAK